MDQPSLPKISKPTPIFKILFLTFCSLIVIALAFWAGYSLNLGCSSPPANQGKSYEDGWNAAHERLKQSGLLRPESEKIFELSGTITAISGNDVAFLTDQVVTDPLAEQAPTDRIIKINSQTRIYKSTVKNREELSEEVAAYEKTLAELEPGATPPPPPSPIRETEITINDLKTDDVISVTSEQNIKFIAEFIAREIKLTPTL